MVWALRMPAAQPGAATPLRTLLWSLFDRRVAAGMWLTTLPSVLFGTVSVLGPLRLDELGAGTAAIAAAFLGAAALEATAAPLMGRLSGPPRPARAERDRRRHRRRGDGRRCRGRSSAWVLGVLIVLAGPAIGILYTPAMAMLSDGAERFGVAQGFAFGFVNLAWATGQAVGDAGSARLADAAGDQRSVPDPRRRLRGHVRVPRARARRSVRRGGR